MRTTWTLCVRSEFSYGSEQQDAVIHLFEYNKYPISTFLLEPLAKKVCKSVAFLLSVSILGG